MIDELKTKIDATGKTLATDNFSAGAKNAEKYTSELRELYDLVVKLEYHIQQLESNPLNFDDSYITAQINQFDKQYGEFINSKYAYSVDADLFDDVNLRELSVLTSKLTRDTNGQIIAYDQMEGESRKAFDTIKTKKKEETGKYYPEW